MLQNRFERYFGGHYLELGHLLYKQLLGHMSTFVDVETFIATVSQLEHVCSGCRNRREAESLIFNVFTEGKNALDERGRF